MEQRWSVRIATFIDIWSTCLHTDCNHLCSQGQFFVHSFVYSNTTIIHSLHSSFYTSHLPLNWDVMGYLITNWILTVPLINWLAKCLVSVHRFTVSHICRAPQLIWPVLFRGFQVRVTRFTGFGNFFYTSGMTLTLGVSWGVSWII
jgi:hypothetical protein